MKYKWIVALSLCAPLVTATPQISRAQSTLGSNGGAIIPGKVGPTVAPNADAGSPASEPETSLSTRSSADPSTREGDVTHQVFLLLPYAAVLALFLVGALYFFVFRKPTSPEGEAATKGKTS